MSNLSSAHVTTPPTATCGGRGAVRAVQSSIQFGAALSAPVMTELGVLPTSWLRLSWAAIALLIWTRPPLHRFGREQWVAAGLLGAASAAMDAAVLRGRAAHTARPGRGDRKFLGPLGVAAAGARSVRALAWPVLALVGVRTADGHRRMQTARTTCWASAWTRPRRLLGRVHRDDEEGGPRVRGPAGPGDVHQRGGPAGVAVRPGSRCRARCRRRCSASRSPSRCWCRCCRTRSR